MEISSIIHRYPKTTPKNIEPTMGISVSIEFPEVYTLLNVVIDSLLLGSTLDVTDEFCSFHPEDPIRACDQSRRSDT